MPHLGLKNSKITPGNKNKQKESHMVLFLNKLNKNEAQLGEERRGDNHCRDSHTNSFNFSLFHTLTIELLNLMGRWAVLTKT